MIFFCWKSTGKWYTENDVTHAENDVTYVENKLRCISNVAVWKSTAKLNFLWRHVPVKQITLQVIFVLQSFNKLANMERRTFWFERIIRNNEKKIWNIWKKSKLKSEMIWQIWKKGKLKCEMIWKIWKKGKSNSEKIWKIQKKIVKRYEKYGKVFFLQNN